MLARHALSVWPEFRVVTTTETVSPGSPRIGDLDVLHRLCVRRGHGRDHHALTEPAGLARAGQHDAKLVGAALPGVRCGPVHARDAHRLAKLGISQEADHCLGQRTRVALGYEKPRDAVEDRVAEAVDV